MSDARQFDDFGQKLDAPVVDLLRALANGTELGPDALALLAQAARGKADRGIVRLLPMAHDHPGTAALPAPVLNAIQLQYIKMRARYVVLEAKALSIAEAMHAEGIPLLFLKGFALASTAYANPVHRPMSDLDLAAPKERYGDAYRVLEGIGFPWVAQRGRGNAIAGVSTHALSFRNPESRVLLDLHYNILSSSLWPSADDGFWREKQPFAVGGFGGAWTLAPEHHVLHACIHGYRRSSLLSIRWMMDSHLLIVKAGERFRWELLEEETARHRCGPLMAGALTYLASNLGTPAPREHIERLAAQPMPDFDRAYFREDAAPQDNAGLWRRASIAWNSCQRQVGRRFWTPLPFARQMARRWGVNSPLNMLRVALPHASAPRATSGRWRDGPSGAGEKRR